MPKTRISCPNCRQPIMAEIEQLFDLNADPSAKQRLLSGAFNIVQCPLCNYQGSLATPIVYHDPGKELMLTFIPPELGLPRDEQERLLGGLINQAVNRLAPEQRKAYLLRPRANLTLQSLVEAILEADGITREMIQAQQQRLDLLKRLVSIADPQARAELLQQEQALVDAEFFGLLTRIGETAVLGEDQEAARRLRDLQEDLLEHTELGRQIKAQAEETQAAVKSLQEAGRELTREKLLDLVIKAPTEDRVRALANLARPGMDYEFFRQLSERIDRARDKGRQRLIELRSLLLELTRQYDEHLQARLNEANQVLNQILQAEDVAQATADNLPLVDEFFIQTLNTEMERVRGRGDLERLSKLQQVTNVIQEATAPPPELALVEDLLEAPDEPSRRQLLLANQDKVTPEFLQILAALLSQVQQANQDPELVRRLEALNRQARRFSMEMSLKQ